MPAIFGNTTGSISQLPNFDVASTLVSFVLTNKSGGILTVSVSIVQQGTVTYGSIGPTKIAADDIYVSNIPITVPPKHIIYITTSGSLDYYFSFETIQ